MNQILPISAANSSNSLAEKESWKELCVYKDKSKKILNPVSDLNVKIYIENHERYSSLFKYDEFTHQKIVVRCPPWEKEEEFRVRPVRDEDAFCLKCDLENFDLLPTLTTVRSALSRVAMLNRINPPREWFSSLKWDGKKRVDDWLITYMGAEYDNKEYVQAVGSKWLIAGVKRVFEPGCKFDQILVLESTQGAGKSTALKALATINGVSYFEDTFTIPDLANEKQVPKMQGILIMELQELAKFSAEADVLKKSLSTGRDRIVRKYENEPTSYPRQFIIAGSHNPFEGYLHDPTGNRRFWPVTVADTIDVDKLKEDVEQLWAEAMERYRANESIMLDPSMYGLARTAQEGREIEDIWSDKILNLVSNQSIVRLNDLMDTIGIAFDKRDQKTARRFGSILRRAGWGRKSIRNPVTHKTETVWAKVSKEKEEVQEEIKW